MNFIKLAKIDIHEVFDFGNFITKLLHISTDTLKCMLKGTVEIYVRSFGRLDDKCNYWSVITSKHVKNVDIGFILLKTDRPILSFSAFNNYNIWLS